MAEYIVREAQPADAAAMIAHIKRIADEPDNGISISSAQEFRVTEEEEIATIKRHAEAENALMVVAEAGGDGGYYHTLGLGTTVHRDWRDRGVGSAMLRYMIDWCATNPAVHKLELWVFPDNPRAIHVYEKLGFQHEGNRRSCFLKQGVYRDLLLMGIVFER